MFSTHRTSVGDVRSCQSYTQDVCGCPSAHIRRPCVSFSTDRTSVAVCVCPCVSVSTHRMCLAVHRTHRTSVGVRQHTQDVCGCPCVSVCVCVSVSTHRTSVAVHQYTYQHVVHTGRLWVSVSTHMTSVCVRQHTQDVRGCLCLSVSTHRTSVAVHQYTYQHVGPWTQHADPSRGLFGLFWPMWAVCSVHTGRSWLSISTHRTSVAVRVCPSAHTGCPWLSVCVHQHTRDVRGLHVGRPWVSASTHRTSVAYLVCPCVSVSTHRTSMFVHQLGSWVDEMDGRWVDLIGKLLGNILNAEDLAEIFVASKECFQNAAALMVWSLVTYSPKWGCIQFRKMLRNISWSPLFDNGSILNSILWFGSERFLVGLETTSKLGCSQMDGLENLRTLVFGLSTLTLPVDCSGDFGPRGLSVQYTQDVRGCPLAHTGHPINISTLVLGLSTLALPVDCLGDFRPIGLSIQYTRDVRGCRSWLSISTHISPLVLGLSTLALPVDCSGDFGPRGLSVQYTQDVRGCPSAHTGRPCVSVSTDKTSVAFCVCPSAHTGCPWLSISTHIRRLVLGLSTLTLPVDCSGDFGPRGLSVQYTQDVRGCPPAHTGRLLLSVCVCVCPSAHTGRSWLSISTHISTLALPMDCSVHTGRLWESVRTHMTSMCVRQHTKDVCSLHTGRPWVSASTHRTSVAVRQHTQDVRGCPCVSVCVCLCPSAHTGRLWLSISTHIRTLVLGLSSLALPVDCSGDFVPRGLSVKYTQDVRGCPSAQTGRPCVSVSTHRGSVAICVSVCVRQHTQDVRGCPSVHISALHTGRPWVSASTHMTYVAVLVCPCVSVSTHRTSLAVHQYTYQHYTQDVRGCPLAHTGHPRLSLCVCVCPCVMLALPVDCLGDFGPRGLSVQYTQDVCGCLPAQTDVCGCPWLSVRTHKTSMCVRVCPPAHTGRPWLSISTYISPLVLGLSTLALPVDCSGDFGPRGLSVQYTQDVRGRPSAHTGRPCVSVSIHRSSVAVRVFPSAHTGRPWLSIGTHISTLVLGLSTLTLPMDCSGDFGPRGLSVQYTQDVHGTHISTLVLGLSTLTLPVDCSGDFGPRGLSVQYTHDVRGCPLAHTGHPWLSLCVCVCPFVYVSTHRTSVSYTQDVCGCLPAQTGRLWLSVAVRQHTQDVNVCLCVSVSTQRTCVAVHQYAYQHVGPWTQHADPSRGLFGASVAVCVCSCVSVSTHRTSVAVHQYTYQHADPSRGLFGTHRTSVAVRVCPTLTLPVDSSGDFGPRGLSVQYTEDVSGCPLAHTGRPWMSVCVRVCPSAHTGRPWLSNSTHISTLVLGLSTLALPMDCLGDCGPRGLSVQYTQDVRGCPSAHTGRPCVSVSTHRTSVAVLVCPCVFMCVRQHTQDVRSCPSVHISARCTHRTTVGVRQHKQDVCGFLWLSVSTHRTSVANQVCPCVSVSTHRTSVSVHPYKYQHAVHTGRPWASVSTHRTSVCVRQHTQVVRGCPCVSVSTHRTSVAVHRYTYQHVGPWTQHTDPSHGLFGRFWPTWAVCSVHTGRPWVSASTDMTTHISTLVLGLSTLTLPVDCSGDFGPRGLSVQYTHDVRGCPLAHTGHPTLVLGLSMLALPVDCLGDFGLRGGCLFSTHRTSVGVFQHKQDVCGCPWLSVSTHKTSMYVCVCPSAHTGRAWLSISTHISTLVLGLSTLTLPVDCSGDFDPCGLSVQHTQDVCVSPSAHTGRQWLSVCVRVCPSAHTGRPWLSISTHISTLTLPVDCSGAFGPRELSVHYTQDVCGCLQAHTLRMCVSVSTHRTSVAVRVCPTLTLPVDSSGDFGPRGLSVQYTEDVSGCPLAHTGRPWMSVCVRVCPSAHTGRPWLSNSTHISTLVLGLSTLALPMDCSGDCGPRGLSVQYTQDVRGCPSAHTGRPCVSVSTHRTSVAVLVCPCVFMCVRQHTQDVRSCPSVHISALHTGRPWVSASTNRMSVAFCGCPSAHTGRPWLTKCVRVCPSAHTGRPCLSIRTNISTLVLGLSTLALPVDYLGDFSPCGMSVQYTQDVRGCPPAQTGRSLLSVAVCQHTQEFCVCPSAHTRCPWLSISTHISPLVLGLSTLVIPVDCSGDFGPRGLSVQYTQDVCGCPSAHTGRPCLSVSIHRTSVAVCVCLCVSVSTHRTSVAIHLYTYQHYTQDVRGCPSAHTGRSCFSVSTHTASVAVFVCPCVSVSTHRTSVAVHQYTYQHVGPWTQHADPSRGLFGTHRTAVAVHQYTYQHISPLLSTLTLPVDSLGDFGPRGLSVQFTEDVRGCPPAHTRRPWLSVCVRVCLSAHTGRPWLSISTHISPLVLGLSTLALGLSTLALGLSTLALPVYSSGDFGPCGLYVQYTQDVHGCPPAHTGRL
ncbi:hypothetical protein YC2023_066343 [Brassica napus]